MMEKKVDKNLNPKIRVYMACSMDGYIAGPNNDLRWLNCDHSRAGDLSNNPNFLQFDQFINEVGCLLMGRTTYNVIEAMGQWVYGDVPVLVATHTPIKNPVASNVSSISGSINELITQAKSKAGSKDVYLDGGNLIQQAFSASLVDEITLTYIPIILANGLRLFENIQNSQSIQFTKYASWSGMFQLSASIIRTAN